MLGVNDVELWVSDEDEASSQAKTPVTKTG